MTAIIKEKVLEGNKLIAEFMSLKAMEVAKGMLDIKYEHNFTTHGFKEQTHEGCLLFHSSWDWLMPVINKAIDYGFHYQLANGEITCWADGMYKYYAPYTSDNEILTNCWVAVVEFIKWYNNNKY